jgi:transaldolase
MSSPSLHSLKVKIFADSANLKEIVKFSSYPYVKGFTTNPSLMRQAGVQDYEKFAREALSHSFPRPISFEVFADELKEIEKQARHIAQWGKNVNIKIPVTTTQKEFTGPVIQNLSQAGIVINVTAITTHEQVEQVCNSFSDKTEGIISVFAGRIADSGIDPEEHMKKSLKIISQKPKLELLWASPRELFNVVQADRIGCPIITLTPPLLDKLTLLGKDLSEYSLETVKMFFDDAKSSQYTIRY